MALDFLRQALREHLAWWGLRHFTSDREYFAWQRQQLSIEELNQLNSQAERKRTGDRFDEIAFYDLAAQPTILPVLYSQRYEYYEEIGLRTTARLGQAKAVLDFGCGIGVLTIFYARLFPEKNFVGVDRSSASVAVAQGKADKLGLRNLRFACVDVETEPLSGAYDLVVVTHALVQAEQDRGLPSRSWRAFEREQDSSQQLSFEQRTGLAIRLDRLCQVLNPSGRMIVNEKTRQLARRVPFQRALANRGLRLAERPALIRYQTVEEVVDDGPLYVLDRKGEAALNWDEQPERDQGQLFDPGAVSMSAGDADRMLYENHWPSAQRAWEQLKDRQVISETTRQAADGRQVHAERGRSRGQHYLYCANTFDQRQLVIVEEAHSAMLDEYYQEIIRGLT
ncbi:MAG: class I SAM-dependent methyltransferase [Nitrospira sp. LK70]|nr:class I SAM-dependent methyltransferase [Nitrospira sp. LK70]